MTYCDSASPLWGSLRTHLVPLCVLGLESPWGALHVGSRVCGAGKWILTCPPVLVCQSLLCLLPDPGTFSCFWFHPPESRTAVRLFVSGSCHCCLLCPRELRHFSSEVSSLWLSLLAPRGWLFSRTRSRYWVPHGPIGLTARASATGLLFQ